MEEKVTSLSVPEDKVRMQAPDNVTCISVRGMQFDIPQGGIVECQASMAEELKSHGFTEAKVKPARKRVDA